MCLLGNSLIPPTWELHVFFFQLDLSLEEMPVHPIVVFAFLSMIPLSFVTLNLSSGCHRVLGVETKESS